MTDPSPTPKFDHALMRMLASLFFLLFIAQIPGLWFLRDEPVWLGPVVTMPPLVGAGFVGYWLARMHVAVHEEGEIEIHEK